MSKIEGVQNKKIQLISMYSYIKRRHEHKMEKWDERRKNGVADRTPGGGTENTSDSRF